MQSVTSLYIVSWLPLDNEEPFTEFKYIALGGKAPRS